MNSSFVLARKVAALTLSATLVCSAFSTSLALADTPLTVSFTSTAPLQPTHTAQNPIPVTATFSEGVINFAPSELNIGNGSVVNFATTSSSVYTFGIVPGASGSVSVDLNGNQVVGDDGQNNQAATQIQFIYDPAAGDASSTATSTTTTASSTAFLSLSSYSGTPGTGFNAIGSNFNATETVDIAFGGATTTATTDGTGAFSAPLTASTSESGATEVTAIGETSYLVATNSFFVEPATSTATSTGSTGTTTGSGSGTTTSGPGAPALVITSGPADGSFTNQPFVTFAFQTDADATTMCTFGSSFACGSPVTLGSTTAPLGDSVYTFMVVATNASSTASTTVSTMFTVDTVPPIITEVTPVPTPNDGTDAMYTFNSTKAGTLSFGGGCTSSTASTTQAATTTVTFDTLGSGTYNCTLAVTDAAGNVSNTLNFTPFTVNAPAPASSGGGGGGGGGGGVISGPLSIGYQVTNPPAATPAPTTEPTPTPTQTTTSEPTVYYPTTYPSSGTGLTDDTGLVPNTGVEDVTAASSSASTTPDISATTLPSSDQTAAAAQSGTSIPVWVWVVLIIIVLVGGAWLLFGTSSRA